MAQSTTQHFMRPITGLAGPYEWRPEPPANLANSSRLEALIRAGRIYLSLQDTISLALENNLDIELQRYALRSVDADLLRARAGGGTVPSYDPTATLNYNWQHVTTPQTSIFSTGSSSLVNTQKIANFGLQQGFRHRHNRQFRLEQHDVQEQFGPERFQSIHQRELQPASDPAPPGRLRAGAEPPRSSAWRRTTSRYRTWPSASR